MTNQITTQTQLSTFNFETHSIRVIAINNEPWFIAKDICSSLNISNVTDALIKLDDDDKMILDNTLGLTESISKQVQEVNLVSESGMYTLILRCREAVKKGSVPHRFRKWVTAEVLPQIRKTGQYSQIAPPKRKRGRPAVNPFGYETYLREFTAKELETLVQLWYYADKQYHFLQSLVPAFEMLNSEYADKIKRTWTDKMSIDWAGDIIARICDRADVMRLAPLITLEKHQRTQHALAVPRF